MKPHSVKVAGEFRNGVQLKLTGTSACRDGEYINERNTSETITISKERAKQIRDDLDEILK